MRVIIAGASSYLGSLTTKALSEKGYNLVLLGRDQHKLENLQSQLLGPSSIYGMNADSNPEQISSSIKQIAELEGDLDGFISFLGYLKPAPLSNTSIEAWQKSLNINLFANIELLRGFSETTYSGKATRSVILMSSVASTRGELGLASYAASKAALESVVKSAAVELSRKKIAVNAIRLGLLQVGMGEDIRKRIGSEAFYSLEKRYPLGIGTGAELLAAVDFLLTQDPAWVTGSILTVDGGYSIT